MANGKTWKLTVDEEELRALINHNNAKLFNECKPEISARLHDLVKRLNKDTPDVEQEQPTAEAQPQANAANTSQW